MPEQCDICGVAALENQRFAEEALPFRRTKRYCPACRRKLYGRVFAVIIFFPVVGCCIGLFETLQRHVSVLDSVLVRWSLLLVFQWLMILPHELGHAVAGRTLGFRGIRILVGSGKPLLSFEAFGIPALINLVPFGGITLRDRAVPVPRSRYLVFLAAGATVNVTAAAIAWWFMAPGELFAFHAGGATMLFFWANVVVLVENLTPHRSPTPFGLLESDGLQLWNVLFKWNKPVELGSARLPSWEVWLRWQLKWTLFAVMAGASMLFVALAILPFLGQGERSDWNLRIVAPVIMLVLAYVTGWAAVRVAKHPVPTVAIPTLSPGSRQVLSLTPEQKGLLEKAAEHANQKDFAAAEAFIDQALSGVPARSASACWPLQQVRLGYIISQNDVARAERVCLAWTNQSVMIEDKIRSLDCLASLLLYKSIPGSLGTAERLARQALDLAPGTLTLKGTLGGILAEQGRIAEAEPLLRECLERSPELHDQGISALYLGVVKLATGRRAEAKRLIRQGMVLHSEPWLLAKAKAKLKELGG